MSAWLAAARPSALLIGDDTLAIRHGLSSTPENLVAITPALRRPDTEAAEIQRTRLPFRFRQRAR